MENSNQPLCEEHHTQASTKRKRKNAARDEKQRELSGRRRSKAMPWFRVWFSDWQGDEISQLDFAAIGFLFVLRMRFVERRGPIPEAVVEQIVRRQGGNRRTADRLLNTLAERGIIRRANGLVWDDVAAAEVELRDEVSPKFAESLPKVSRNFSEKPNEINGGGGRGKNIDTRGEPPHGGSPSESDSKYWKGSASAGAGRPHTSGEEVPTDDVNLEVLESLRANYERFEVDPFVPDFEDIEAHPDDSLPSPAKNGLVGHNQSPVSEDGEVGEWGFENFSREDFAKRSANILELLDDRPKSIDVRDPVQVVAFDEGIFAADCGLARTAIPYELRDPSRSAIAAAWIAGYDHAKSNLSGARSDDGAGGVPFDNKDVKTNKTKEQGNGRAA